MHTWLIWLKSLIAKGVVLLIQGQITGENNIHFVFSIYERDRELALMHNSSIKQPTWCNVMKLDPKNLTLVVVIRPCVCYAVMILIEIVSLMY